jgi:hypothetical protein
MELKKNGIIRVYFRYKGPNRKKSEFASTSNKEK